MFIREGKSAIGTAQTARNRLFTELQNFLPRHFSRCVPRWGWYSPCVASCATAQVKPSNRTETSMNIFRIP